MADIIMGTDDRDAPTASSDTQNPRPDTVPDKRKRRPKKAQLKERGEQQKAKVQKSQAERDEETRLHNKQLKVQEKARRRKAKAQKKALKRGQDDGKLHGKTLLRQKKLEKRLLQHARDKQAVDDFYDIINRQNADKTAGNVANHLSDAKSDDKGAKQTPLSKREKYRLRKAADKKPMDAWVDKRMLERHMDSLVCRIGGMGVDDEQDHKEESLDEEAVIRSRALQEKRMYRKKRHEETIANARARKQLCGQWRSMRSIQVQQEKLQIRHDGNGSTQYSFPVSEQQHNLPTNDCGGGLPQHASSTGQVALTNLPIRLASSRMMVKQEDMMDHENTMEHGHVVDYKNMVDHEMRDPMK